MDGQLGINPLENNHLLQQIPNFRIDQFKSTKNSIWEFLPLLVENKGKGLITWDFFLGKLPRRSACIQYHKAKNAWKKKQDYRNEKKTRDAKNGASDNNLLSPP